MSEVRHAVQVCALRFGYLTMMEGIWRLQCGKNCALSEMGEAKNYGELRRWRRRDARKAHRHEEEREGERDGKIETDRALVTLSLSSWEYFCVATGLVGGVLDMYYFVYVWGAVQFQAADIEDEDRMTSFHCFVRKCSDRSKGGNTS